MREFSDLGVFAAHLAERAAIMHEVEHRSLERAAVLLESKAKEKIGTYQPEAGPFVAWAQLADSTVADRTDKGFGPDDPLLRTGAMRDSIEHQVEGTVAEIGSNSDIAVFQELGTEKIPPRSFLGGAGVENGEKVGQIAGDEYMIALVGEGVFQRRIPLKP